MAKAKHRASSTTPKKKSGGLAAIRRRRRLRANPAPERTSRARANPPLGSDITSVLLPGFGAYALTRVLQRIVYTVVQKRWPKLGKHAHAAAGVAAFGGVWFFAHRIAAVAKYHDGIVMGSGVAALHGIAQCYLPKKYSWLLADCKSSDVLSLPATDDATTSSSAKANSPAVGDDEYSYLERQLDAMSGDARVRTMPGARGANAMTTDGGALDPALTEELGDEDIDDLYTGAFSTN